MLVLSPDQRAALDAVAERWGIRVLDLFGSAVGDAFGAESDVDLIVDVPPDARWSLFDVAELEAELETVMQRPVDLVTRRAVERSANPHRRASILDSARPLYRRAA